MRYLSCNQLIKIEAKAYKLNYGKIKKKFICNK